MTKKGYKDLIRIFQIVTDFMKLIFIFRSELLIVCIWPGKWILEKDGLTLSISSLVTNENFPWIKPFFCSITIWTEAPLPYIYCRCTSHVIQQLIQHITLHSTANKCLLGWLYWSRTSILVYYTKHILIYFTIQYNISFLHDLYSVIFQW